MKLLYENRISAVTASEEYDATFADDLLLNTHPQHRWEATSRDATLTFTSGMASAFALFNTNAKSATVTLKTIADVTIASQDYDLVGIRDWYGWWNWLPQPQKSLWFDYGDDLQGGTHKIVVDLDTEDSTERVYAGVGYSGFHYETGRGIVYGARQGINSYSIQKQLSNGSRYTKKRARTKWFDVRLLLNRSGRDFYFFMENIAQESDIDPIAWKLTDINNVDWTVFGHFEAPPTSVHDLPDDSWVEFRINEEV